MYEPPLLTINNIHLKYGNNHVLKGISANINAGEVYALVGEHGAGKSSLGRILSGFTPALQGEIYYKGRLQNSYSSEKAIANNVLLVPQNNFGFGNLSIAENLFMNRKKKKRRIFNAARQRKEALRFFNDLGVSLDPEQNLNDLNLSDKIFVYLLKQIHAKPELLILDESLEMLATDSLEIVIPLIQELVDSGSAVILITHRIDDIFKLAKNLIILRNGSVVFNGALENIDKISLIRLAYMQLTQEEIIEHGDNNLTDILKYNEAILTKLPLHLFIVDNKLNIRLINNKAKKLLKISLNIGEKLNFQKVFSAYPDFLEKIIEGLTKQKEIIINNFDFKSNDEKITFNIKIVPVFELAHYIGSIITLEDITKEESLRSQVILSENLAAIGMLAAGVAHEINNPLEMINYSLQDLKFRDKTQSFTEELNGLEEEMKSIASIVKNLVVFSDNQVHNIHKFSVKKLIKDIIRLIKFKAQESNIEFSLNFPDKDLSVRANKTEIRQVLLNLLKNSIEAMKSGGKLSIELTKSNNDHIEIILTDEGGGIPIDNPNDIFLPFYSTKNDDSRNTGLGLSISYNLVKKNAGEIYFENNPPIGCKFKVILPQ